MKKILIIDDEEKLRKLFARIIGLEGFEVFEASNAKASLKLLEHKDIDVIICDVKLPDGNGVELIKPLLQQAPFSEIILLTAYGNIKDGVQAIKNGAFEYIVKGDDNDRIIPLIYRAIETVELHKRLHHLETRVGDRFSFDSVIGTSRPIQQAITLGKKVAPTDATVLLLGETGTGKEIFAQAIHQASLRKQKSFVAINCSAFSRDLLESELFGHKAGSFTGALKDKKGLFEEANGGTLFLDEIGEMSVELQAKLLRVLESGEFIKVGESTTTKVNVRIVAATNRDLQKEIESGHFRQDLFYRLSVFQITLPSLRERVTDIEPLAMYFAEHYSAQTNQPVKQISHEYLEALKQHTWPGNIRELKNVIERSVIIESGIELTVSGLPVEMQITPAKGEGKQLSAFSLASVEKLHIQKVLNYTNHNKTEAARLLNIAVTTLYRKLEEYKIS